MRILDRLRRRGPSSGDDPATGDEDAIAADPATGGAGAGAGRLADGPAGTRAEAPRAVPPPAAVACPSCARLIDPPPARSRHCPHCRRPIVVRHTGGRTVYLTEAAVEVFEAERRREIDEAAWFAARERWLRLARDAGVPQDRRDRAAGRPVSEAAVGEARDLYLAASAKEIRAATRTHDWAAAARRGRERATARYRDAGSPVPVPAEIRADHDAAMKALLRSLRGMGTHAELVADACCTACRAEGGRTFPIDAELRASRLPHEGCPRGLCACEWWLGGTPSRRSRRRNAPRAGSG